MRDKIKNNQSISGGMPRAIEITMALIGSVLAAPIIFLAAIAIALTSRGPVIFRQPRVGQKGRTFVLFKLRTMNVRSKGPLVTADGDVRVTRVGKFLRKTKLDELPELWNILRGDMSLVGPRPERPECVDQESQMWQLVLEVKPGITDPTTLRLRNEETLLANVKGDPDQFYLKTLQPFKLSGYLDYLRGRSWWTDVKILCKTLLVIAFPRMAPAPTAEEIACAVKGSSPRRRSLGV